MGEIDLTSYVITKPQVFGRYRKKQWCWYHRCFETNFIEIDFIVITKLIAPQIFILSAYR